MEEWGFEVKRLFSLKKHWKISILIFLITSVPIFGAGETALNFLRIGTSARGAALADSLAADYSDSSAVEYNPAALLNLTGREIQLMHINLYADIDYESLIYVEQFDKFNLALSLNYLHTNALRTVIDTSDPYGYKNIGKFVFQDRCFAATFTPRKGIWGGRVKYIEERIEDEKAGAPAADFGFLVPGKLSYGAALCNMGPEIKFIDVKEKLPQTLRMAVKLNLKYISLYSAGNFYIDRKTSGACAMEANIINVVFLRAGYKYIPEDNGEFPGFTFGIGIKIREIGFDYAFIPFGEFGDTQRFSLQIKWGKRKGDGGN
ncbi:MAG: PorV/PorQ family protein [Candidatus Omnitrophica bacterium]|nr:PorV/PorQ family protein [Candidatus Omnitrophota bacterium]